MIVVACFAAATAAHAENWPSRLIRATIPFGAGSAADVVPRLVFDRLSAEIGQPIVIENRPGAGGTLGSAMVVKADPDGYNILAQSSALAIAPAIYPKLTFDVRKDLASVLMIGAGANVMIVSPARPWKTVQDFIADAKAKPGSMSFGSVGVGSAVHISAEKFRLAAGIETTHVPYRGGAEVIADILGGRIDFYFCPLATALPLLRFKYKSWYASWSYSSKYKREAIRSVKVSKSSTSGKRSYKMKCACVKLFMLCFLTFLEF